MDGPQKRNTRGLRQSQRCGAKTRKGGACKSPAVSGKKRCRMHGGAEGSGAPPGNQNALKHGIYTREALAERKALRALMREAAETLVKFERR
jgi:glucans biosynthesis protein